MIHMTMEFVSSSFIILFVSILASLIELVVSSNSGSFVDPFMDSLPYVIKWGPSLEYIEEEAQKLGDRHVLVTTDKDERYQCVLPVVKTDDKDHAKQYTGPTATELLQPMLTQKECSYRIESYWTYELCHAKHLRQYHETREQSTPAKVQEYFLGYGNHRTLEKLDEVDDDSSKPLPTKEIEGETFPYYEVIMSDGTKCDLTDVPRKAHVLYVCHKDGRGEVYQLKEISTCEYEVVVLTALLCNHPKYSPRPKAVNEINCYSFIGSPIKPSQLINNENEAKFFESASQNLVVTTSEDTQGGPTPPTPANQPPAVDPTVMMHRKDKTAQPPTPSSTPPPSKLGAITDKQTMRDFFTGQKCLRGGQGWWKHEICFGKHVKQYHMEKGKENNIFLGYWDIEKHMDWLKANPLKRPKDINIRKHISHFYTNGELCDLTGKPRTCELRLKCIENTRNPHAIMLSLAEPSPCSYVLTVDSALFCPILKDANSDAMFDNLDLS